MVKPRTPRRLRCQRTLRSEVLLNLDSSRPFLCLCYFLRLSLRFTIGEVHQLHARLESTCYSLRSSPLEPFGGVLTPQRKRLHSVDSLVDVVIVTSKRWTSGFDLHKKDRSRNARTCKKGRSADNSKHGCSPLIGLL